MCCLYSYKVLNSETLWIKNSKHFHIISFCKMFQDVNHKLNKNSFCVSMRSCYWSDLCEVCLPAPGTSPLSWWWGPWRTPSCPSAPRCSEAACPSCRFYRMAAGCMLSSRSPEQSQEEEMESLDDVTVVWLIQTVWTFFNFTNNEEATLCMLLYGRAKSKFCFHYKVFN